MKGENHPGNPLYRDEDGRYDGTGFEKMRVVDSTNNQEKLILKISVFVSGKEFPHYGPSITPWRDTSYTDREIRREYIS